MLGLSVIHLDLVPAAAGAVISRALATCGGRLEEIRAAVTEADASFGPDALEALPLEAALLAPVDMVSAALVRAYGCVV